MNKLLSIPVKELLQACRARRRMLKTSRTAIEETHRALCTVCYVLSRRLHSMARVAPDWKAIPVHVVPELTALLDAANDIRSLAGPVRLAPAQLQQLLTEWGDLQRLVRTLKHSAMLSRLSVFCAASAHDQLWASA